MAYIIFLQPAILTGEYFGASNGTDKGAVITATCLAAALATAIMGLYARYPIGQAPGMGENFVFALSVIPAAGADAVANSTLVGRFAVADRITSPPPSMGPTFLKFVGIPLTHSIGDGLALGFMSYPIIKLLAGQGRNVKWLMYVLAVVLAGYFVLVRCWA